MGEKALKASIWLVAVFCVVAVWQSKVQSQELKKSGRYYVAEINKTYEVGDGGRLIVSEVRGNVEVTAGADGQVIIHEIIKMDIFTREEAEAAVRRSKSSYLQKGNVIEVGGGYHRRNWIQSEFDISVPASFDVEVETRGGDIEVGGVNGNVELSTSGGDITLKDIGGEVEVEFSTAPIVCVFILRVHDNARRHGDLGARMLVQVRHGERRVEAPVIEAELSPVVVVCRLSAHGDHGVDGG